MNWDSSLPINKLPAEISFIFSEEAKYLIKDLEVNKLEIACVPAPEPKFPEHKIRVVVNSNPEWYKNIFSLYEHFKRKRCVDALERIAEKKDKPFRTRSYIYDARMRKLIYEKVYNTGSYETASLKINNPNKKFNIQKEPVSLFFEFEKDSNSKDVPF